MCGGSTKSGRPAQAPAEPPPDDADDSSVGAILAKARRAESSRSKQQSLKPYIANFTSFEPEVEVSRKSRDLKQENDLLRKCLQDSKNPRAFEGYLRTKTTF